MKAKIIILSTVISLVTLTVASTQTAKLPKAAVKKAVTVEPRVNKGLAMEDKNQFN
ncbi:MAG: hypothetical protein HOP08_18370 [Cyclobacteriaceae bacterium]|nr:hypothetical protein [Cyclobacteriaceae bacterium]